MQRHILTPQQLPPPLMLHLLTVSRPYVNATVHRKFYDKVKACFLAQFKAFIPYRVEAPSPISDP